MTDFFKDSKFSTGNLNDLILPLSRYVVGGIGVGVTSSVDGLLLLCEPYRNMREADVISVYIYQTGGGNDPIHIHSVTREEINNNVIMIVPPERIRSGWFTLYYTVTHADSGISDRSDTLSLWVKLEVPGGIDPRPPTQNINENLAVPQLPASILYNGVDAELAKRGVPVTISPYENMRVRDRINLSWGGVNISQIVTEEDVGNRVVITVDETAIARAGDSDRLLVYYEIRDEVNNTSKFSPEQAINVDVAGNRLPAPIVKEAKNNSINLDNLTKQQITVQVWANVGDFNLNDSVWLQLAGRNAAGESIYREAYLSVTSLPSTIEFIVDYKDFSVFAGGYFITSYILIKAANDMRIPSRKTTVTVNGTLPDYLPAPDVDEAVANNLDGNLEYATVTIPVSSSLFKGAEILVFWRGITADGGNYNSIYPVEIVSVDKPASVLINKKAIEALVGGTVSIYYQFISADRVTLTSAKTVINITQTLSAPVIPDSINNVLDPEKIVSGVVVTVPQWPLMARGDRVDLYWKSNHPEGDFSDWLNISDIAAGKPVKFIVPKSEADKNINNIVNVFYKVTYASGLSLYSGIVPLLIGHATNTDLQPVVVEQATNDIINFSDLSTDVLVHVPAYKNMHNGDLITLYLNGDTRWQETRQITDRMVGSDVLFIIPLATISANKDKKITLYYRVQGVNNVISISPERVLSIVTTPASLLPAPEVNEERNGALYPDELPRYVKLTISPYPDMAAGDIITAFLTGLTLWQDYWPVSGGSVDKNIIFYIGKDVIAANINTTIYLHYQVEHAHGGLSFSEKKILQVKTEELSLSAPQVAGQVNGILDVTLLPVNGALVTIPAWSGMMAGDEVTLYWGATYTQYRPVSGNLVGKDIQLTVPLAEIEPLINSRIAVSYQIKPLNGVGSHSPSLILYLQSDELPAPRVAQATGGVITVSGVADGVEVIIPAAARLQDGDFIALFWQSTLSTAEEVYNKTIFAGDTGRDYPIAIATEVVQAAAGGDVSLHYVIHRNGRRIESPIRRYAVVRDAYNGNVMVMGARSSVGSFRALAKSRSLTAVDRDSGKPVSLRWQYDGESTAVSASRFADTQPWKALNVSSDDETITVLPLNVIANGDDAATDLNAAMIAKRNDGTVVAWGDEQYGSDVPKTLTEIVAIQEICSSSGAFAARLKNNSVVAWGDTERGGTVSAAIKKLTNIVSLSAGSQAIAAILSTGKVVAWGHASYGGTIPANIASFNNIVKVVGSGGAFAALRANHRVVAWGKSAFGGLIPTAIANLTNIKDIGCSYSAYVALTHENRLVTWGSKLHGGTLPEAIADLNDVSEIMASNSHAFVVQRTNGLLAAWGADTHGGTLPDNLAYITDVVEIVATGKAFIALRRDGTVISWGDKDSGGVLSQEIANLRDIVQIAATASAFAVLRANGTIIASGAPLYGGDTAPVASKLVNCSALYSSTGAFAALTADHRLVVWGNTLSGGDNSAVSDHINGAISYQR